MWNMQQFLSEKIKTPPYKGNTFKECNDISRWGIEKNQSIILIFVIRLFQQSYTGFLFVTCLVRDEDKGWNFFF